MASMNVNLELTMRVEVSEELNKRLMTALENEDDDLTEELYEEIAQIAINDLTRFSGEGFDYDVIDVY